MSTNDEQSFAVTVTAIDGKWRVAEFDDSLADIDTSIKAVRSLRAEGVSFAMLCIDDDYLALARPTPTGVKLLISDATAALEDDFAASILDKLGAEYPSEGDGPYAEGDFDMFEDLGLNEQVLSVICDDEEAWASEQILAIAEELGFAEQLADLLDLDF
ncbi:tRNA adenosine deaminase-associated protein [Corynebacterium epidermidicanis]|uniref:Putative tRNA adenosine deaminase-associated protein n=1 Tax=Corynebacterium epidermidicanis TaxID=1050174 RepID=A0A0G3GTI0_9CORY|nr:tRNA adenosine deaminase-associated protein [Corynebacterium epidermidicanis]AKK02112.1 putative tRNA adenosine deaminase-associated protein [Corynebacterium epidermidicanis]